MRAYSSVSPNFVWMMTDKGLRNLGHRDPPVYSIRFVESTLVDLV